MQIPLGFIIIIQHFLVEYFQHIGVEKIYFTHVAYVPAGTLAIHIALSLTIFLLCGLWAYNFKVSGEQQIGQSFEIGKLQEAHQQKDALIAMSENLKISNLRLKETSRELKNIFNTIDEVLFSIDMESCRLVQISAACERIYGYPASHFMACSNLWLSVIHHDDRKLVEQNDALLMQGRIVINQYRIIRKDKNIRWVEVKIIPSFDRDGKLIRKDGIVKDISERKMAEEVLRESYDNRIISERLMKTAEELARFGSWQYDVEKGIVYWSDGAFHLYGYKPGDHAASYDFLKHVHPEDRNMVKENLVYAWKNLSFHKLCFRIIDRKGKLKYLQAELIIERNSTDKPVKLTGFKQDISEKMILEKHLADERICKQQEITNAVITAQEQERSFLGEELHDNINPILATVKLYIDCALTDEDRRIGLIKDAKEFISTAMNEIRTLSKSILPPSLGEVGLVCSLNDLVENIQNVNDLHFETNWENIDEDELCEKLKLTVYRIVQEQLNNIIKHACAKNVKIKLWQKGKLLKLSVTDNGRGFDTNKKRDGVGIKNIISRADLFNGKVLINSRVGMGCELLVDFIKKSIPVITELAQAS